MAVCVRLNADNLLAALAPEVGGSLLQLDWNDGDKTWPVLRPGPDRIGSPLEAACFPLVPFSNRIRGGSFMFRGRKISLGSNMQGDPSPLHGQGWLSPWQVEKASRNSAELSFHHRPAEWPWEYRARQIFTLDGHGLAITISCSNLSDEPMPCGLGMHPYFQCSPTTKLHTQVSHVWTVDDNVLPIAKIEAKGRYDLSSGPICGRALDNGYEGWGGKALIEDVEAPFSVSLSSPDTQFFQLYSPAQGGLFVAEPVSHANDALSHDEGEWPALGMRVLPPGEIMALSMRLDVIRRPQT